MKKRERELQIYRDNCYSMKGPQRCTDFRREKGRGMETAVARVCQLLEKERMKRDFRTDFFSFSIKFETPFKRRKEPKDISLSLSLISPP